MTSLEKQKAFIAELEKIYGKAILKEGAYIYSFENVTYQSQISKETLIDQTTLNRLLNVHLANKKDRSFEKYTEWIKRCHKLNRYDGVLKRYKYLIITLITILFSVVSVLLGSLIFDKYFNDGVKSIELSSDQANIVTALIGEGNVYNLAFEASLLNEELKGIYPSVSRTDSINFVSKARQTAKRVIEKSRTTFKTLNFFHVKDSNGVHYTLSEYLEKKSPQSEMFKCTDNEIAFSEDISSCAGNYDKEFYGICHLIFDPKITNRKMRDEVKNKVLNAQRDQRNNR